MFCMKTMFWNCCQCWGLWKATSVVVFCRDCGTKLFLVMQFSSNNYSWDKCCIKLYIWLPKVLANNGRSISCLSSTWDFSWMFVSIGNLSWSDRAWRLLDVLVENTLIILYLILANFISGLLQEQLFLTVKCIPFGRKANFWLLFLEKKNFFFSESHSTWSPMCTLHPWGAVILPPPAPEATLSFWSLMWSGMTLGQFTCCMHVL